MNKAKVWYERPLPGGGFVHVEEDGPAEDTHRGRISVERRSDPARREGHEPPVIASVEGQSSTSVFQKLLSIARDNVEVARALLRLDGDGKAKF
jgi:hypothetical protein